MTVAPFSPSERPASTGGDRAAQFLSTRYGSSGSYIVVLPGAPAPKPPTEYVRTTLTLDVPAQLREALAALSLNKSQLADVLGIARPTLYEWLDGQDPSPAKADRLFALMRLLARLGVSSTAPLNARFVRQTVDEAGDSLLSRLGEATWDEPRIEALVAQACALDLAATDKLAGREARLQGLGYEEPSAEQRRALLAQNVAARDWPT
jgi:transcriptional regulator with XRE-family HTH domain